MPRSRTQAEDRAITAMARLAKLAKVAKLAAAAHTATRQADEATAAAERARADVTQVIIETAPLLGEEQREQIRGALA
jgi:hypothetical protein